MAKRKTTRRTRRTFTTEFKAEVVELVRDGGQLVSQVARNLDLTESAVRGWLAKAQPAKESSISSDDEGELKRASRREQTASSGAGHTGKGHDGFNRSAQHLFETV